MDRRPHQSKGQPGPGSLRQSWKLLELEQPPFFPATIFKIKQWLVSCCFKILWGANGFDLAEVSLYLQRIVSDHDSTPEPLRKALSFKEATRLHQATGCFLFMLDALQKIAPASRFGDMKTSLENQFFMKFMDGDLVHCLEERVPLSADLTMVSAFRLGAMMTQSVVRAGCDWGYC